MSIFSNRVCIAVLGNSTIVIFALTRHHTIHVRKTIIVRGTVTVGKIHHCGWTKSKAFPAAFSAVSKKTVLNSACVIWVWKGQCLLSSIEGTLTDMKEPGRKIIVTAAILRQILTKKERLTKMNVSYPYVIIAELSF